ncbi:hypothetical protein HPP92_009384 [Vanilla planifolia]|uniref:Protein EARLY HEADING DATE 2 n=1 Tax=Vanilla planifolia TaxID=51239 RepID=A0A835RE64_VANPL|nr:hypothetical protein HPP92_009384 [Vanilla planifolia]
MFPSSATSLSTSISEEASASPENRFLADFSPLVSVLQQPAKKKRSPPGNPDPEAEVVALSPETLLATNRFLCELCNKGFRRDQNLQLHRRGHNLPWRLRQRSGKETAKKRVYVCPEPSCVHHHPARALGDLTGIKKHFSRKHGEKKWKCDKCSKKYAVFSDWKAHVKSCGSREYLCDCGTLFSRKDSFVTHRAFCDALAEESARLTAGSNTHLAVSSPALFSTTWDCSSSLNPNPNSLLFPNRNHNANPFHPYLFSEHQQYHFPATSSATAMLQRASAMGHLPPAAVGRFVREAMPVLPGGDRLTIDFLGGVAPGEELLQLSGHGVGVVTSSSCVHGAAPPTTGAWGDF